MITGALGAPYLVYLLVHTNRAGGFPVTDHHTLNVEWVTLGYGDRVVVDALDLPVPPGRIAAIVGANACGKSTLLRAIPTSGC